MSSSDADKLRPCLVAWLGPGTIADPFEAAPPKSKPEVRSVTRGMNGVSKRKRPEIEDTEIEASESDGLECLGSHDKSTTICSSQKYELRKAR